MAKLTDIMNEVDPCWKGYKQVGMKEKDGREVPNCVPESVELDESEFSPMGYAQKVVNGKLSFSAALKDSEMRATDLLKLIRKIDKNYNPKFESVNEEQYKVMGRPVTLNKGKKSTGVDWTVTFQNGKTAPLADVLTLIKPFPKGITAKESVDSLNEKLPNDFANIPNNGHVNGALKHLQDQMGFVIKSIKSGKPVYKSHLVKMANIIKSLQMYESVNEGHFGEIDIMAQNASNFREFVKDFYKEYKDFPKDRDTMKWLESLYKSRANEGLDSQGLERVGDGLPQTEEEPSTDIFKELVSISETLKK